MKPFTAGLLAAVAILIGWSIDGEVNDSTPPTTIPRSAVTYVEITDPPATTSTTSTISSTTTSTTFAPALLPVDHVCYEWLPTMLDAGWPRDPDVLATALTIAWRESRCIPTADSGPDHGIWQINRYWCRPSRYSAAGWLQDQGIVTDCDDLFDPMTNARAALAIYRYSLDRNGDGFVPWTTYSGRP